MDQSVYAGDIGEKQYWKWSPGIREVACSYNHCLQMLFKVCTALKFEHNLS